MSGTPPYMDHLAPVTLLLILKLRRNIEYKEHRFLLKGEGNMDMETWSIKQQHVAHETLHLTSLYSYTMQVSTLTPIMCL